MISVIFILDTAELSEEQGAFVQGAIAPGGAWEMIGEKDGRQIFDAVIPSEEIVQGMVQFFGDRHPVIVGQWNEDGTEIPPIDLKEYSELLKTTSETHQFYGWPKREGFITEETL